MIRWLLVRTGKWHAWLYGAHRTVCGALNAQDLERIPAQRITSTPDPQGNFCKTCLKKLPPGDRPSEPRTTHANPIVGQWLMFLRRHISRSKVRVNQADLEALAERLASIGGPGNEAALTVYEQLRRLILTPRYTKTQSGTVVPRLRKLKEALALLPVADPSRLRHIAESLVLWRKITGREVERNERFQPDTVIATMLEIPDPEPYIQHLHQQGLDALALVFHPNTLARRKEDAAVRGVFAHSGDYWKDTADQLENQTVKDT